MILYFSYPFIDNKIEISFRIKDDFKKYEQTFTKEIKDKYYLKHFYDDKEREKRYGRWINWEGISFWEVNQIIGWIELYLDGIKIKANLWFIKSKRLIKRPKRKIIDYKGKLGDVTSIEYNDNAKLRTDILKFIEDAQKGSYGFGLEKYHINPNWLLKIIDHLDIKSIVESNLKR